MSRRSPDPLDELRRADPATVSRQPSDSKARVWARVQEATMESHNGPPKRIAIGVVAAVLTAAAVIALVVAARPPQAEESGPAPNVGMCVEFYSLETLANRDFAFDGTVTAIAGDEVTFAVAETFLGDYDGSVTLRSVGASAVTTAGGPQLEEGGRYLVAGDADNVWGCGFTQPYDDATAQDWAEAAS